MTETTVDPAPLWKRAAVLAAAAFAASYLTGLAAILADVATSPSWRGELLTVLVGPLLGVALGFHAAFLLLWAAFRWAGPEAGIGRLTLAGVGAGLAYLALGGVAAALENFAFTLATGTLPVESAGRELWRWIAGDYVVLPKPLIVVALAAPPVAGGIAGLVYAGLRGFGGRTTAPRPSPAEGLAIVLLKARELLAQPTNDYSWSSWGSAEAALAELDPFVVALRAGERVYTVTLSVLFAPTGPIQEVSASSGWADAFLHLAAEFDAALARYEADG